jgi:hypothetical protein
VLAPRDRLPRGLVAAHRTWQGGRHPENRSDAVESGCTARRILAAAARLSDG